MVDMADCLVRLVHAVYKGQAYVTRIDLELREDGVTKGFSGNACAVGDEKYGAVGHVAIR